MHKLLSDLKKREKEHKDKWQTLLAMGAMPDVSITGFVDTDEEEVEVVPPIRGQFVLYRKRLGVQEFSKLKKFFNK